MKSRTLALTVAAGLIGGASNSWAIECTDFVKQQLTLAHPSQNFYVPATAGNAGTWYNAAKAAYGAGAVWSQPANGFIMVFAANPPGVPVGHVAIVNGVTSVAQLPNQQQLKVQEPGANSAITINQANWPADPKGGVGHAPDTVPVATNNGWKTASMFAPPDIKTTNHALYNWTKPELIAGFINTAAFPALKKK